MSRYKNYKIYGIDKSGVGTNRPSEISSNRHNVTLQCKYAFIYARQTRLMNSG